MARPKQLTTTIMRDNMNNILSLNNVPTMSSTEIAQLTGKEVKHVHRDIKVQLIEGLYSIDTKASPNLDRIDLKGIFVIHRNNGQIKEIKLDREHTLTLITGYDVKSRHAINKRWIELETELNKPKTALELAREQVVLLELIEEQEKKIAQKDELIIASNEASIKAGEILVREFVKSVDIIDLGEKQFYQWMRDQKIIMESRQPYQDYVTRGFFTWKPTEEEHGGKFRYTLRITPRGKIWLAARYMAYLDQEFAA
jgi:phage antirepressor YoqD-like protein